MKRLNRGYHRTAIPMRRLTGAASRRWSLRLSVVAGLAMLMFAVPLTGVAYAGTNGMTGGGKGPSAAEDQYGTHHVVQPVKPSTHVAPAATTATAPTATTPGTLPFTGFAVFKVVLIGLGLVALGFALRRLKPRNEP